MAGKDGAGQRGEEARVKVARLARPRSSPAWLGSLAIAILLLAIARPANATRAIFIWFADGGLPPPSAKKICVGRPPAFTCPLGSVADCRAPIQALLDRWYADFDVVFTYLPPTPGDAGALPTDTVVVSNDGAWCGADAQTVSRSPLPTCTDPGGGGAVAIFRCGADLKACATLMAKEQAHLVGLQHTGSATDVMNERGALDHDGFEDRDNLSAAPGCGPRQNSYQLMLQRLGRWAGGPKPGPGEPPPPNGSSNPDAQVPEPTADGGPGSASDAADPAPTSDASAGTSADAATDAAGTPAPASDGSGCSCQLGAVGGAGPGGAAAVLLALFAGLSLARPVRQRRDRALVVPSKRGNPGPNRA
jgi:hypothetical protein